MTFFWLSPPLTLLAPPPKRNSSYAIQNLSIGATYLRQPQGNWIGSLASVGFQLLRRRLPVWIRSSCPSASAKAGRIESKVYGKEWHWGLCMQTY